MSELCASYRMLSDPNGQNDLRDVRRPAEMDTIASNGAWESLRCGKLEGPLLVGGGVVQRPSARSLRGVKRDRLGDLANRKRATETRWVDVR